MIKGVIFDMDGTLLDSMPHWRTVSSGYIRSKGLEPAPDLDAKLAGASLIEGSTHLRDHYLPHMTAEDILDEVGGHIVDVYAQNVPAKPGAIEALRGLKAQGVKIALATASERRHSDPAFIRLGVFDCFDGLYTCQQAGHGKTDPAVFLLAAREMGLAPHEVAVVEDAPYALKTAREAGFLTVAVPDPTADWAEAQAIAHHSLASLEDWEVMLTW